MLFASRATSLLTRSSLTRSSTLVTRTVNKRVKSSSAAETEEAASSGGSLVAAVATTFGTYCLADFLSNFLQHPTQKVCVYYHKFTQYNSLRFSVVDGFSLHILVMLC